MTHFQSKNGVVTWNDELQSVVIEWKGFAYGQEFQTILMEGAKLLKQMNGSKVLMDTRNGSAIKAEDKVWIGEFFIRRAFESGLQYLALLQPHSVVAKLSLNRTVEGLGTLPYRQESFTEWDEAVRWLTNPSPLLSAIS
ncbi:hypothetical protein [Paenibacillus cineris]|uniref:STAS/SEC14 domain-containing protein n=1 Tax=Paenibacillus cineris TaxID=237530 RepID=A0ABQ4L930_9BACL|nr:hypothetical protein [Paenibacillus cineris]GIO52805.1 hypothetical protein J21TS7_11230 [Paenibacillus cineris]